MNNTYIEDGDRFVEIGRYTGVMYGVVIRDNITKSEFVTHGFRVDAPNNYYHGHYFSYRYPIDEDKAKLEAFEDFCRRVISEMIIN